MCTNKSPDILVSGRWDEVRSSTKRKALSVTLYASSATVGRTSHRICKIKEKSS